MTRINTIDPELLLDQHLVAEWRELPRIVNELIQYPHRFKASEVSPVYILNTGHVKFFRNKIIYLAKRHMRLKREMDKRGIKRDPSVRVVRTNLPERIREQCMNDYTPDFDAHMINIERICERFDLRKKKYHFKKDVVDCEHSFNQYLRLVEQNHNLGFTDAA